MEKQKNKYEYPVPESRLVIRAIEILAGIVSYTAKRARIVEYDEFYEDLMELEALSLGRESEYLREKEKREQEEEKYHY